MSDLISRDEALTALRDTLKSGGKSKGLRPVTFEMIWAIKSLPSAEPKKGKWVQTNPPERSDNIVCDQCGYDSIAKFIYCPNCGAKMEGLDE